MALGFDDGVQLGPFFFRAANGRGVDGPDHPVHVVVVQSVETVVRAGHDRFALDRHPFPARPEHDRDARPKMRKLLRSSACHEAHNWITGDRVVDNTRVDHRDLRPSVVPERDNDGEPVFPRPQLAHSVEL
jgi:hypothetical protein